MSEVSAWEKFVATGSVKDYLEYANVKENLLNKTQGSVYGADQFGRIDSKPDEYRGYR